MKYFYLPGDFLGERLCCVLIKYVLLMKMYEWCSLSVVMIEHFNTSPLLYIHAQADNEACLL